MLSLRLIQCEAFRATHEITHIEEYLLSTEDEYSVYHDHSFVCVAIMVAIFFLSTAISQESKAHEKKLSFSSTSYLNKYLTLIGESKRVLFWISLFFNKTSQGSFSKEILWERDWIFPQNMRFLLSELLLSIQV